jgi:hypothetical protein
MSRDVRDLTPELQEKEQEFALKMLEAGLPFAITCTLRTKNEHVALYAQHREPLAAVNELRRVAKLPPITEEENKKCVTWTLNSRHFAGKDGKARAFDFVLLKANKPTWDIKCDIDDDDIPDYIEAGAIAKSIGLIWGGDFKDKKGDPAPDMVHVELPNPALSTKDDPWQSLRDMRHSS